MRVELLTMTLRNWRGAENVTINFRHGETVISGTNKTGKSTLAEAYRWAFTGKDSLDRKDYDLKNTVKTHLNRGDHEVILNLDVDGQKKEVRRVFREIWQRPRGQETEVFKGNETQFFVNDVPFNAGQFAEVIKGWFSDIQFKILTDPLFFNTPNGEKWKWTYMRDVLVGMAGTIERDDVFEAANIFGDRREALNEAIKTWGALDKLKKEVAEKKRKANEELRGIPESIESQEKTKPAVYDWHGLQTEIETVAARFDKITEDIFQASKGDEGIEQQKQDLRNEIRYIEGRMKDIEADIKDRFRTANGERRDNITKKQSEIRDIESTISLRERDVANHERDVQKYAKEKELLWDEYTKAKEEQAPEIDPKECACPTCRREYPADQIEAAKSDWLKNWNEKHANKLTEFRSKGSEVKKKLTDSEAAVLNEKAQLESAKSQKENLVLQLAELEKVKEFTQSDLTTELQADGPYNEQHSDLTMKKRQLEKLDEPTERDENAKIALEELKAKKQTIAAELSELRQKLATRVQYERVVEEIHRLKEKQTKAGQAIAELEGIEFAIDSYNQARNEVVQNRVNRMFPESISFKLFDTLNDGTPVEFCELYMDGMPWGVLNTGAKINAGLMCIDTFQSHWGMYLPIWIDNRESTVEIPVMLSQVVNLIVDPTKDKITVS